jgi:hypothetical protein
MNKLLIDVIYEDDIVSFLLSSTRFILYDIMYKLRSLYNNNRNDNNYYNKA